MKKAYISNCLCPICRNQLFTSDIEEYPFLCITCDEYFYACDVKEISGDFAEISVEATTEELESHESKLQEAVESAEADFFGYDEVVGFIDIGWNEAPSAKKVHIITKVFDNIQKQKGV